MRPSLLPIGVSKIAGLRRGNPAPLLQRDPLELQRHSAKPSTSPGWEASHGRLEGIYFAQRPTYPDLLEAAQCMTRCLPLYLTQKDPKRAPSSITLWSSLERGEKTFSLGSECRHFSGGTREPFAALWSVMNGPLSCSHYRKRM